MNLKILEQLGLSPNESKIYEALLDLNEAGIGEISTKAEIHRRNVYDAINRLIDKGLIFPILSKKENLYSPVDPDKLLEILKEKESDLLNILPDLRRRHKENKRKQEAYIYRGIEGFKNYMRDILRVGEDVFFIGAKLGWYDPKINAFRKQCEKEIKRKKIKLHHIFDHEVKLKEKELLNEVGGDYRFLPEKFSTNSAIDIFGEYIVTFTGLKVKEVENDVTLFVLKDRNLANSYKVWFNFMWELLPKE